MNKTTFLQDQSSEDANGQRALVILSTTVTVTRLKNLAEARSRAIFMDASHIDNSKSDRVLKRYARLVVHGMPAFQNLVQTSQKRKSEAHDEYLASRKRQTTDSLHGAADASGIANDPNKAGEQYWTVLWYALLIVGYLIYNTLQA